MSAGNITILNGGDLSTSPTRRFQTEAGGTAINYGEPVKLKVAASQYVIPMADAEPVIGTTTAFVGIAATNSTHTASANGTVDVILPLPGITYLCAPKTAASVDTQAEYNALVNDPVLFDLTSSVYTVDTDATATTSGLVIEDLDIKKYPGRVAFRIRTSGTILN